MAKRKKKTNPKNLAFTFILFIGLGIAGFYQNKEPVESIPSYALEEIPVYENMPYVVLNDNEPNFNEEDLTTTSFETYSELDSLNRCGIAKANIGIDLMPIE